MSFHSGSRVMRAVVTATLKNVPDEEARRDIYRETIRALNDVDWQDHPDLFG